MSELEKFIAQIGLLCSTLPLKGKIVAELKDGQPALLLKDKSGEAVDLSNLAPFFPRILLNKEAVINAISGGTLSVSIAIGDSLEEKK